MKKNISIYLTENVIKQVEAFAKNENRSKSNAVEYLLEQALKNSK